MDRFLGPICIAAGLSVLVLPACVSTQALAQDASMSCQQIADGVSRQNAIIKDKNDDRASLQNQRPDPGAADPAIQERLDQMAADKATARANSLVALGRQKKCFK